MQCAGGRAADRKTRAIVRPVCLPACLLTAVFRTVKPGGKTRAENGRGFAMNSPTRRRDSRCQALPRSTKGCHSLNHFCDGRLIGLKLVFPCLTSSQRRSVGLLPSSTRSQLRAGAAMRAAGWPGIFQAAGQAGRQAAIYTDVRRCLRRTSPKVGQSATVRLLQNEVRLPWMGTMIVEQNDERKERNGTTYAGGDGQLAVIPYVCKQGAARVRDVTSVRMCLRHGKAPYVRDNWCTYNTGKL